MLYELTNIIERDENFNYILKEENKDVPYFLEDFIIENRKLNLPFVSIILEKCFPFLHNKFVKKDIIENSIKQGQCVHKMISDSINQRNNFKLNLVINDCKNSNHISIAKGIITELNSFIYKYEIDQIYSEKTYLYLGFDCNYIGTIDIILKSKDKYYIMDIKTSRVNYVNKYNAQLFLYKKLFESATNNLVEKCFILNPREERIFMEYEPLNKKEQGRLLFVTKEIKPI